MLVAIFKHIVQLDDPDDCLKKDTIANDMFEDYPLI
jgi:hypothetical protein